LQRAAIIEVTKGKLKVPKRFSHLNSQSNIKQRGATQTMSHNVDSRPLTKLDDGLSKLHSTDDDAVQWLANHRWNVNPHKKHEED